jgi:hypothetical protein
MLNKKLPLTLMGQKVIKLFLLLLFISCNSSNTKPISIYGKWVDTKNKNIIVNIDSVTRILTIDYSAIGGKIFTGQYSVSQKNKIESEIIPNGIEIEFDKNENIKLYPIKKTYTIEIESIYALTFAKKLTKATQ